MEAASTVTEGETANVFLGRAISKYVVTVAVAASTAAVGEAVDKDMCSCSYGEQYPNS